MGITSNKNNVLQANQASRQFLKKQSSSIANDRFRAHYDDAHVKMLKTS